MHAAQLGDSRICGPVKCAARFPRGEHALHLLTRSPVVGTAAILLSRPLKRRLARLLDESTPLLCRVRAAEPVDIRHVPDHISEISRLMPSLAQMNVPIPTESRTDDPHVLPHDCIIREIIGILNGDRDDDLLRQQIAAIRPERVHGQPLRAQLPLTELGRTGEDQSLPV